MASGGLGFGGGGGNVWSEALPKLTEAAELQKMLADEKMRSEQHKTNYQTLKVEHTRLQDEFVSLQQELRSTIEESKLVQDKNKGIIDTLRRELTAKHAECEELKTQVMTGQRKEVLKLQLQEEVEAPFRQKLASTSEELEYLRSEYNKLKYEASFIKTEYEHEKAENQRILDELKLRHEAEVSNLRAERETMQARQSGGSDQDSSRLRTIQRENAQLHLKIKGLLTELEEIRAQREHMGLQSDNVTRMQGKQLAEHQANIKALQTERDSLKLQVENLQKEIASTSDLHTHLNSKVHELEKENIVLKNRAEEVTHKSKVELTNLKMDMLKERGDLERQRDRLNNAMEDLRSQIDIFKHQISQQEAALVEKEREAVRRVQAAREEEWTKTTQAENEKLELETRLQELERRKIDDETRQQADREKMEERMQAAYETKDTAEKEALVYKTKLQHQESVMEQLEQARSENSDLKMRVHRLETEYNSYVSNENQLLELNSRLKSQVDHASEELRRGREEVSKSRDTVDKTIAEYRANFAEERLNLQRRVDELEDQLSQSQVKVAQLNSSQKKKKKKYVKVAVKLKDRVSLLTAKMEELQIERDTLRKSVPPETHHKLKKQLNDLLRRHREFRSMLTVADLKQVAIGDMSFASVGGEPGIRLAPLPDGLDGAVDLDFMDDEKHQKDLDLLKERLDLLDDNQRAQLDELRQFSKVSTPIKGTRGMSTSAGCSFSSDEENKDAQETEKHLQS